MLLIISPSKEKICVESAVNNFFYAGILELFLSKKHSFLTKIFQEIEEKEARRSVKQNSYFVITLSGEESLMLESFFKYKI